MTATNCAAGVGVSCVIVVYTGVSVGATASQTVEVVWTTSVKVSVTVKIE